MKNRTSPSDPNIKIPKPSNPYFFKCCISDKKIKVEWCWRKLYACMNIIVDHTIYSIKSIRLQTKRKREKLRSTCKKHWGIKKDSSIKSWKQRKQFFLTLSHRHIVSCVVSLSWMQLSWTYKLIFITASRIYFLHT